MGWHDDCSTTDGWDTTDFYGIENTLTTDEESIFANSIVLNSGEYTGFELTKDLLTDGDFEAIFDISIPTFTGSDTSEFYFQLLIEFENANINSSNSNMFIFNDGNDIKITLEVEDFFFENIVSLPYNFIYRLKKVGTELSFYLNNDLLGTITEPEDLFIYWLYMDNYANCGTQPYQWDSAKINDVNIIGNVSFPQNNPNLSGLSLIVPEGKKSSGTYYTYNNTYKETVGSNVDTANMIISTIQDTTTITLNGNSVEKDVLIPISLNIGENIFNIHIVSGDETETLDITYTITRRDFVSDIYLPKEIYIIGSNRIIPAIDFLNINNYIVEYQDDSSYYHFYIDLLDELTTCEINGEIMKKDGKHISHYFSKVTWLSGVNIKLTSEDETNTVTYNFKFNNLEEGSGSLEDPFQIKSAEDLISMSEQTFVENWGEYYNIIPSEGTVEVLFVYKINITDEEIYIGYKETIDGNIVYGIKKYLINTKETINFATFDEEPKEMCYCYINSVYVFFVRNLYNQIYSLNKDTGEKTLLWTPGEFGGITIPYHNLLYVPSDGVYAIADNIDGKSTLVKWITNAWTPATNGPVDLSIKTIERIYPYIYLITTSGEVHAYHKTSGYLGKKASTFFNYSIYDYNNLKTITYGNYIYATSIGGYRSGLIRYKKDAIEWEEMIHTNSGDSLENLFGIDNSGNVYFYLKTPYYEYPENGTLLISDFNNKKWNILLYDKDLRFINENVYFGSFGNSDDNKIFVISKKGEIFTYKHIPHYFKQMNDISLEEYSPWNPLCNKSEFKHNFNGNNYEITNLVINPTKKNINEYHGLFSSISVEGKIENINIKNGIINILEEDFIDYDGPSDIGFLAGILWRGEINNCKITGTININCNDEDLYSSEIGGIFGEIVSEDDEHTKLNFCDVDIIINNLGGLYNTFTGGIAGYASGDYESGLKISNCRVKGNITGDSYIGIFVGQGLDLDIENCSIEGNIISRMGYTGSFGGELNDSNITNTFGKVNITILERLDGIGGFVGDAYTLNCNNCYSVATIINQSGESYHGQYNNTGAFIDDQSDEVVLTNCYYNREILDPELIDIWGAIPKTTAEMKTQSTFVDWDFENVWNIDGDYPFLISSLAEEEEGITLLGTGTEEDPYLISNAVELNEVRNYLDAYFLQVADIDLTEYENWEPIGTEPISFEGNYNGNGFNIDNLKIDKPTTQYIGLFGYVNGYSNNSKLENINIKNINITGKYFIGGLVGEAYCTKIFRCCTSGVINGEGCIGGIVGHQYGAYDSLKIENCFSSCNITSTNDYDGTGGIIGLAENQVINCYSIGIITCNEVDIKGGLIGTYATSSYLPVLNSYYDSNLSTCTDTGKGEPKTTAEMKTQSTFNNWDFDTIWRIDSSTNNGYPYLYSQLIEIWTAEDLNNVRNDLSGNYIQMADIDLSEYENWEPIGTIIPFSGSYNGDNFKITNLSIVPTGGINWGLFGYVETSESIQNIKIEDAVINITDDTLEGYLSYIGSLIGCCYDGQIINCHTDVTINITCNDYRTSTNDMGGLIGIFEPDNKFSCVKNCTAHTVINNYGELYNKGCGALLGNAWGAGGWQDSIRNLIQDCHATGIMSGESYIGGLIGRGGRVYLERCSAITEILCNDGHSSGIAGELDAFTAKDCYAICKITCNNDPDGIGGFCANAWADNTYENCYSVLEFINNSGVDPYDGGAFIGDYGDEPVSMTNCYYNSTITTLTDPYATPKTTAEMKTQSTFVDWDFENVWNIDGDYPFLISSLAEEEEDIIIPTVIVPFNHMGLFLSNNNLNISKMFYRVNNNWYSAIESLIKADGKWYPKREFNVKDYGAIGDGLTDDTQAINYTISLANLQKGATVLIPDGIYLIDPTIGIIAMDNVKLKLTDNAVLQLFGGNEGEDEEEPENVVLHNDCSSLDGFTVVKDVSDFNLISDNGSIYVEETIIPPGLKTIDLELFLYNLQEIDIDPNNFQFEMDIDIPNVVNDLHYKCLDIMLFFDIEEEEDCLFNFYYDNDVMDGGVSSQKVRDLELDSWRPDSYNIPLPFSGKLIVKKIGTTVQFYIDDMLFYEIINLSILNIINFTYLNVNFYYDKDNINDEIPLTQFKINDIVFKRLDS